MIWLNKIIEIIFSKWGWKDIWKYYVIWGDLTYLYYLYYYKNERCFCQYFGSIFTYMPIFFRLFFTWNSFCWSHGFCSIFRFGHSARFFCGLIFLMVVWFFFAAFFAWNRFFVTRFLFDLLRSDPRAQRASATATSCTSPYVYSFNWL